LTQDAPQRRHDLGEIDTALRWLVHPGAPWRYLPGDLLPWQAVYQ
jgi:transposase